MQKIGKAEKILKPKIYQIKIKKTPNNSAPCSTIMCKEATLGTRNTTKHIGSIFVKTKPLKWCRNLFHSEKWCLINTSSSLSWNNKLRPFVVFGKCLPNFLSCHPNRCCGLYLFLAAPDRTSQAQWLWEMFPTTNHSFLCKFTPTIELC